MPAAVSGSAIGTFTVGVPGVPASDSPTPTIVYNTKKKQPSYRALPRIPRRTKEQLETEIAALLLLMR